MENSIQTGKKAAENPTAHATSHGTPNIMHISIDDTIKLFSDLTANAGVFTSLFDHEMLACFRKLHNSYGAVFSCYVFSTDGSFSLCRTTDQFKSEFTENKGWLKFGFHARSTDNYAATTALEAKSDYDTVINQLIRITGSQACIDRVVRLHNFAGNLESMLAMKNTSCGILGLLCADDPRNSYYLNAAASQFVYMNNRYHDASAQLTFFPTSLRMESVSDLDARLMDLEKTYQAKKTHDLIIFSHESQLNVETKTKLEKCCRHACEHGYTFAFPMNTLM